MSKSTNQPDYASEIRLWTNSRGNSCVKNFTEDELKQAFLLAEETGDDLLYCAVMDEVSRRKLRIME